MNLILNLKLIRNLFKWYKKKVLSVVYIQQILMEKKMLMGLVIMEVVYIMEINRMKIGIIIIIKKINVKSYIMKL